MSLFLISCELRNSRSYAPLLDQLQSWQCVTILKNCWLAQLRGPARVLMTTLETHLNSDDGLIVIELRPDFDWALANAYANGVQWIARHSPASE